MCLAGASGAGAELLAALPHPDLRVRYVWVPVLPPDDRAAAAAAAERFAEPRPDERPSGRATHYWDGERGLAQRLGESLGISAKGSLGVEGAQGWPGTSTWRTRGARPTCSARRSGCTSWA